MRAQPRALFIIGPIVQEPLNGECLRREVEQGKCVRHLTGPTKSSAAQPAETMASFDSSPGFTMTIRRKSLFDVQNSIDPSGIFTLYTSDTCNVPPLAVNRRSLFGRSPSPKIPRRTLGRTIADPARACRWDRMGRRPDPDRLAGRKMPRTSSRRCQVLAGPRETGRSRVPRQAQHGPW